MIKKLWTFFIKYGLCCFNSYRTRLSLTEVLLFFLMFSRALIMSSVLFKFCKATYLFEIFIWYCFLTSSSLSFLRLNLQPTPSHISRFQVWNKIYIIIQNLGNWGRWGVSARYGPSTHKRFHFFFLPFTQVN